MVKNKKFKPFLIKELDKAVGRAVMDLQREIVLNTPINTGWLRNRIIVEKKAPLHYLVGTPVKYAEYLELGTGLYGYKHQKIRPKKAKVLHWKDKHTKKDVFAKSVRGVRPYRTFLKASRKFKGFLNKRLHELR